MILASKQARLEIDLAAGGRLASLQVHGHELLGGDRADPLGWGCYPLAPWAGRLCRGRFGFGGKDHRVPVNLRPHAIHGTVFKHAWEQIGDAAIATGLGPQWPYAGRAVQRFGLEGSVLRVRLELHAQREAFPASLGFHPWFRRNLGGSAPAELDFQARARLALDTTGIPTGELLPPGAGPWDDCFLGVADAPAILWPDVLRLRLFAETRCWVVYDRPAHAFCVEPWTAPPDALNREEAAIVEPGRPLVLEMTLEWEMLSG